MGRTWDERETSSLVFNMARMKLPKAIAIKITSMSRFEFGLFSRKPCNYFNHTCLPCGGFHFLDPPRNLVSRGWSAAGGVPKYRVCSKSQRYPKIAVAQTPLNLFRLTSGLSSLPVAAWPPNASRAVGMQLHASTLTIMTRMGIQLVKALVLISYLLRDFCPLPSRLSIEFPFVLFCFD